MTAAHTAKGLPVECLALIQIINTKSRHLLSPVKVNRLGWETQLAVITS
jgi:hypothetical protein